MDLKIDVTLQYELGPQRTALLALQAARVDDQVIHEDCLDIADAELSAIEGESGIGQRCWVRVSGETLRLNYRATVGVTRRPVALSGLSATPFSEVPYAQIPFLRPSRYCQSDMLERFAADRFGHLDGGERIIAMVDWIGENMSYDPAHSNSETTLIDTFAARRGVCRDYAHMLCGLARASYIPARYVAAYGLSVEPPDFHAVVEVWLGGGWQMVDPTGMCSADEIVVIGAGRDAADVPFMETPDEAQFIEQSVRVSAA